MGPDRNHLESQFSQARLLDQQFHVSVQRLKQLLLPVVIRELRQFKLAESVIEIVPRSD